MIFCGARISLEPDPMTLKILSVVDNKAKFDELNEQESEKLKIRTKN